MDALMHSILYSSQDIPANNAIQPNQRAMESATEFATNVKNQRFLDTSKVSRTALYNIALFVEQQLPGLIAKGKYYLHSKDIKLPCSIEYDPTTGKKFIHFKNLTLGEGYFKRAKRSLIYDPKKPHVCTAITLRRDRTNPKASKQFADEIELYKKLQQKTSHIIKTIAVTEHEHRKTGTRKKVLIQENYTPLSAIAKSVDSIRDKLKIAKGTLGGLHELHKMKNTLHRDLHDGNLYVDQEMNGFLGDFGWSKSKFLVKSGQAQARFETIAPELVNAKRATPHMYERGEIYSLGLSLYKLLYKESPVWATKKHSPLVKGKKNQKKNVSKLRHTIHAKTDAGRKALGHKKQKNGERSLNATEMLEYVVLQMLNPNPMKRKTAKHWKHTCERALKKIAS